MNDTEDRVECSIHGPQGPAFVCRHLDLSHVVGFVEAYDPDQPDAEMFQAWCSACDQVLLAEGEWNDTSEAFASPRMVCQACYRQMKILNQPAEPLPSQPPPSPPSSSQPPPSDPSPSDLPPNG